MGKSYLLLLPLILGGCVAPVAMGGASMVGLSAVEDRGIGGVTSDQALRAKLNMDLLHKYEYSGVSLTVYRGRVLLTGNVPNEQIRQEVLAIGKNTEGVREIIDGLKVQTGDDFGQDARDSWITVRLKTSLYADQDIYAPNYLVHTFDKIVYIFGKSETPEELQRVLGHAREVSGVRNVVNLVDEAKHQGNMSQRLVLPPVSGTPGVTGEGGQPRQLQQAAPPPTSIF